jgi:hypothetical protein
MKDRKLQLLIDALILAGNALDEMSEDEIQEQFGSDYYYELKRFIGWEAKQEWRNNISKAPN